jgi:hypothetical protein
MPKKKKKAEKTKQQDEAKQVVQASEGPLKEMLVNYVGEKHSPENNEVTVEMIVETVANEFPDFLLVVAKENWIRGYQQAMFDVENIENEHESIVQ